MVSWSTIKSLLIFFGPLFLPKVLAYYRSLRSRPASQLKPLPRKTSYALGALFLSGLAAFLSTLPLFSPANLFQQTQSRLQTPGGVLMTRLAAVRPITEADEHLRHVLDEGGLEARLLYARLGPAVLAGCSKLILPNELDAGTTYLVYALPRILAPHLLHVLALGIATSRILSGVEGARWRTQATIAGLVLGLAELWFVVTYDDRTNARSTRLGEVDFVFWKVQVWRGLAIAAVDGLLGLVVWLQATGRAFLTLPPTAERLAEHSRLLEGVLNKTRGLGMVRNGAMRDAEMRKRIDAYWVKEQEVMKDVFEQPEVLEAQRNALRRVDATRVGREADAYLRTILGPVQPEQARVQ